MNNVHYLSFLRPASDMESTAGSGPSQVASLAGRRILIVDDNSDAADSLAMLLEYLGAEVRVANSGTSALKVLDAYLPQVLLLDIAMPDMDGYALAKQVRSQPNHAGTMLIALSGWGQDEDKRRASESGFNHHLTKPVDLQVLESLLAASA